MLECQDYLWRMRFALHFVAERNENRLLFDYQASVANLMGFGDEGKSAVERMMNRFFRTISRVAELNAMLLLHFEHTILKTDHQIKAITVNQDFSHNNGLILTSDSRIFMRSVKIIEMFLVQKRLKI